MMSADIEALAPAGINRLAGSQHDVQKFVHTPIHQRLADDTGLDGFHELPGTVAAGGWHFQIGSCPDTLGEVIVCPPIGYHKAVKAPVIPQSILQKMLVFVGVDPADHVIGGHDAHGIPLLHGDLKTREVDLAKGSLIQD